MKTKNSIYLMASKFLGLAASFFAIRFIVEWVGKPAYGLVLYSFAIASFVSFVDIGFMLGSQKYMIEALMEKDHDLAHRIQRCQSALCLVNGSVGCLIYVLIGLFLPYQDISRTTSFVVFSLAGFSFLSSMYAQVFTTTAIVYNRFPALTLGTALKDLLQTAFILWLSWTYRSPVALALGYAVGSVVSLVCFWLALRLAGAEVYVRPLWDFPLIKHISAIGIRNVPNNIVGNLANRGDKVVLGKFATNATAFTDYSFATKPVEIGYDLLRSSIVTLMPEFTQHLKADRTLAAKSVYRNGLIVWSLGACVMIPASAYGDLFLRAWLKQFAPAGGGIVMVLMAYYYVSEMHHLTLGTLFAANGTPHKLIGFAAANGLLTLALTMPMFHWLGLAGLGLMNAGIAALQLPFRVWITAKELAVPFHAVSYVSRALAALAVCVGVYLAGLWVANNWPPASEKFAFLPLAAVSVALSLALCFGTGLVPAPEFVTKLRGKPSQPENSITDNR